MKFFTNKKFLFKLIVSICLCLTIWNFGIMSVAQAAHISASEAENGEEHGGIKEIISGAMGEEIEYNDGCYRDYLGNVTSSDGEAVEEFNASEAVDNTTDSTGDGSLISTVGGKLLDPVCDLLLVLGDGVIGIIQKSIMGTDATAIYDNRKASWWGKVVAAIAVVVVIVIACVYIPGAVAWLAGMAKAIAPFVAKAVLIGVATNIVTNGAVTAAISSLSAVHFGDYVVLPTFTIGPEEIFSGNILLFDANVFNPKKVYVQIEGSDAEIELEKWNGNGEVKQYYYYRDGQKVPTSTNNSANELKDTIAKWYFAIRNIALVGLMLVLVYVGIRILISSIAADKAKYKQMFGDWVVALCLVFLMHYIMVFANSFVENLTQVFASVTDSKTEIVAITNPSDKLKDAMQELEKETGEELYVEDGNFIQWPTNLMGRFRIAAQNKDGTAEYVGYTICYIVLVMFTAFFSFTYIKRLLYLLFLTVIAPLVALTYPLDKIKDGQAQAFNMWLKEYIFNLLIQPFHLLLYTVFIGMAFELASKSIIYSLVVIGFMIPAEKFLRNMFGFSKASTPGFLAGPAGAAMTVSAMKSLSNFAGKGGNKAKLESGSTSNQKDGKVRTRDSAYTSNRVLRDAFQGDNEEERRNGRDNLPEGGDETPEEPVEHQQAEFNHENSHDDVTEEQQEQHFPIRQIEPDDEQTASQRQLEEVDEEPEPESDMLSNNNKFSEALGYAGARFSNFAHRTFTPKTITGIAKKTASTAVKYGLGATGAAIGVGAGIASGSPKDALTYGTAGLYAGSSIGKGATNRVGEIYEKEKSLHEEALKTQYGESAFEQKQNKKLDEKFFKDAEKRKQYAQYFNVKKKEDIDKLMTQAIEYRKRGVTDDKIIMKAMDIDPTDRTNNKSIAAALLAPNATTLKDLDTTMQRLGKVPGSKKHLADMEKRIKKINGLKI